MRYAKVFKGLDFSPGMPAVSPLLFNIVLIAASLYILIKSSDLIIYGISGYAKRLGLSKYLIGMLVIAAAASLPEVLSSVTGLLLKQNDIMIGVILGTCMVHLCLVTGIMGIVGKKLNVDCKILEPKLLLWVFLVLPFVLMLNGVLSRADGIVLLGAFVFHVGYLWKREGTLGKIKKSVQLKTIWKDCFIFLGSLLALLLAARYLVFGSLNIANFLAIPSYFISLTLIGIGDAIPDFAICIKSVLKGHYEVGLGDVLGSTVMEFLLYFGIVALIKPITIAFSTILNASIFLVLAVTLMMFILKKRILTWKHGLLLVGMYVLFIAIEILKI